MGHDPLPPRPPASPPLAAPRRDPAGDDAVVMLLGEPRTPPVDLAAARARLRGRRVLLIDADPAVAWYLHGALTEVGVHVTVCEDTEAGLDVAEHEHPDVIVADALAPDLDGVQLATLLGRDPVLRDVPRVLLAWREDQLLRVRELGADASGYLRKHGAMDDMFAALGRAFDPQLALEGALDEADEVTRSLEPHTPARWLEAVSARSTRARLRVRTAGRVFLAEVEHGALVALGTDGEDGERLSGERALAALLGLVAGSVDVVIDQRSTHRLDLAELRSQLAPCLDRARLSRRALLRAALPRVASLGLDREQASRYLELCPPRFATGLRRLLDGVPPVTAQVDGGLSPGELARILDELCRRGLVERVVGHRGEDRIAETASARAARTAARELESPIVEAPRFTFELSEEPPFAVAEPEDLVAERATPVTTTVPLRAGIVHSAMTVTPLSPVTSSVRMPGESPVTSSVRMPGESPVTTSVRMPWESPDLPSPMVTTVAFGGGASSSPSPVVTEVALDAFGDLGGLVETPGPAPVIDDDWAAPSTRPPPPAPRITVTRPDPTLVAPLASDAPLPACATPAPSEHLLMESPVPVADIGGLSALAPEVAPANEVAMPEAPPADADQGPVVADDVDVALTPSAPAPSTARQWQDGMAARAAFGALRLLARSVPTGRTLTGFGAAVAVAAGAYLVVSTGIAPDAQEATSSGTPVSSARLPVAAVKVSESSGIIRSDEGPDADADDDEAPTTGPREGNPEDLRVRVIAMPERAAGHLPEGDGWVEIDVGDDRRVYVDGQFIGPGPVRLLPLAPGQHELLFRLNDTGRKYPLKVEAGKAYRVAFERKG